MLLQKTAVTLLSLTLTACASSSSVTQSASPYAGQEARNIKALSEVEIASYLEGRGMGFAKPAELNGYPGPMHVVELADALALTAEQRAGSEALMRSHKAEVRVLGKTLIGVEEEIEQLFATRSVNPALLRNVLAKSADLQRRIRESHLATHLTQTALLTQAQIASYSKLRGYDASGKAQPSLHSHH